MKNEEHSRPLLEVQGLNYGYSGRRILDSLNLDLFPGEIIALIGPNGIGKTTALKLISKILQQQEESGRILFQGRNIRDFSLRDFAQRVVYLSSELQTEFPLTVFESVLLGRLPASGRALSGKITPGDQDTVSRALENCECWDWKDRYVHTLSGGERQWVSFARALAQGGQVLLLDESFSKLDLDRRAAAVRLLKNQAQQGKGIILVSHDLNFALECGTRAVLWSKDHRLTSGPLPGFMTTENIGKVFSEVKAYTVEDPHSGEKKVFLGN